MQPPYIGISARHGGLIKKSPGLFELAATPQTSEGKVRVTKRCGGLETWSEGDQQVETQLVTNRLVHGGESGLLSRQAFETSERSGNPAHHFCLYC